MDWRGTCIVPLYKWKGDKSESSNLRGISLLIVALPYGRVLIKRVRDELNVQKERNNMGCMGQAFALKQVCKKYLANGKDVVWAFMDLEKAYDTIDRHGMLQMQSVWSWRKIVDSRAEFLCR